MNENLQKDYVLPANLRQKKFNALLEVLKVNSQIIHAPQERDPRGLTLFHATEARPEDGPNDQISKAWKDPAFGCGSLGVSPIQAHYVSGDHSSMMIECHVQVLARLLEDCFRKASDKTESAAQVG